MLGFNTYTHKTHVTYGVHYELFQVMFYGYCVWLTYCFNQSGNWSSNLLQTSSRRMFGFNFSMSCSKYLIH